MAQKRRKEDHTTTSIHQYYLDIINCIPGVVYWIDTNCILQGCNHNFVKLLGLKHVKDFSGTPYASMKSCSGWSDERIESFRLDDMKVLFSGEQQCNVEEEPVCNKQKEVLYFLSNRVPLFNKNKDVIGLVVTLTDMTLSKKLDMQKKQAHPAIHKVSNNGTIGLREPNILIVEDNVIAQKVEEALLTALHCHVDIAESCNKAITLFDPGKYDIVFMDIGLEDSSGYVVAKKLRQMEKDTAYHVPIIALTSYQADLIKSDCNDYFMDGVITKPLTDEQAKQIIQHFVHHENVSVNGLKSMN